MKKKNFLFIIFASVLFFSVFIFYVFFYPMNKKKTVIELVKGDRLTMVADRLYDAKIINSKFFFKLWMYLSWNQNNLKVGEYEIAENASLNDIKNTVTSGRMYNKFLTIPEGLTVRQIFEILNQYDDLSGKITVKVVDGELLPQTYAYNKMVSKDDIILKMKQAMSDVIDNEWENRDENLPLKDKKEAIILASMVEKETSIPEERAVVASVFYNRLARNMRLQSDPTVVYTLTKKYGNMRGRKLYKKDLEVVTPYNTYKIKGLPIGAIANPGIESIRAVLHPAKTNYFYFVADGSGGHKFAETLEEHEKNRANWKKIRDKVEKY
ncbi:MAG: endolytic transglycosylase MltG [Alphaproteobacteria bacterium]|nr:endolytic transglycosylase MltG [Alphaproteobacteria bacterium]